MSESSTQKFLFFGGITVQVTNGQVATPKSINLVDSTDGREIKVPQSKKKFLEHLIKIDPDTFRDMTETLDQNSEDYKIAMELFEKQDAEFPTSSEEEYNT